MMPGMIMLWYGTEESIPSGWHLCDGTVGTPDLTDLFVVGAGGAFAPNITGGEGVHTHNFTSDSHNHGFRSGDDVINSSPNGQFLNVVEGKVVTGTTDIEAHLPPFRALCYIMKL